MDPTIAYLARGQLHLKADSAPVHTVESRFGQTVVDRALQIDQRHSWKSQGRGAQFMGRGMLWGGEPGRDGIRVAITSLSRGREPGEVLYALESRDIAGVFAVAAGGAEERRLFHGNDHRVRHLAADPGRGLIACSVRHDNGNAAIAVMGADGSDVTEVTEGDTVDQAPSWVPGTARQLVLQSAGIGRDKDGAFHSLGPFAVKRLDLDQGELRTLLEDSAHDLLGPRVATDGSLLCIRRPYKGRSGATFVGAMKDFLLFPARLLYAIFQWLNFFTARYSGRPLTTAGGPKREGADIKQMMIWGNLIDAEQAARESAGRGDDTPDLVPSSWQLVRRTADGAVQALASGVVSFDVAEDGAVVYTNGSAVYLIGAEGKRRRLCVDAGIEQVVVVGATA
jgi:hypothetical protein